jgi:ribosome-associated protein
MRTALELRLDVRASSLPDAVKQRLVTLAGRKLTADGVLLIDGREHRTQAQNREAARAWLGALLRQAAVVPASRKHVPWHTFTEPRRRHRHSCARG